MARNKNQVQEMGRPKIGLSGPLETHCRSDDEGNAKFQECLARIISQKDRVWQPNCQNNEQQQKQHVSRLTQFFGKPKGCHGHVNKVLVSITVLGSAGPLRVIVVSNATTIEVIKQALTMYSKEGRRPALGLTVSHFELRYLQDPSQVLEPNEIIGGLGFRQFLLSRKKDDSASPLDGTGRRDNQSPIVEGGNSWWSSLMASVASGLFLQTVGSNGDNSQQLHTVSCL